MGVGPLLQVGELAGVGSVPVAETRPCDILSRTPIVCPPWLCLESGFLKA
jgi:hypothetical protein